MKRFLYSYGGFDRSYLQDYLNLYCLIMNPPKEKLSKIEKVLISAISNPKKLTYRDLYSKKILSILLDTNRPTVQIMILFLSKPKKKL